MNRIVSKNLICFLLIQGILGFTPGVCSALDAECLSPQLSIDSSGLKQACLLTEPLAEVVRQIFFTNPKTYLPYATRLEKFFRPENKIVQLQISEGCPNKCLLCAHGPDNFTSHLRHMPFEQIESHLDILKAAGVKTVSICLDFEPMFYYDNGKDAADVIELIHEKGLDCWIVTHGWDQGNEIPKRAAERIAALPFSVYVLLSYHIWHADVLNDPSSEVIKKKYSDRFSEVVEAFTVNPQTGERSNVQLEYRYVSDRMEKFKEINDLQWEIWEYLAERFDIPDDIVDFEWGIEWSKGLAADMAKKFGVEVPELFNKWGWLDRVLQNIHFSIKMDGKMYFLVEALALEKVDAETLMGDLFKKGYIVEESPQKINEVYWYRIIPPEEQILSLGLHTRKFGLNMSNATGVNWSI